jgi:imidazolonepropionase-like amidohydrolase
MKRRPALEARAGIGAAIVLALVVAAVPARSAAPRSTAPRSTAPRSTAPPLAIVDVTVIDATGGKPQPHSTVIVRDGRIVSVGPNRAVRPPADALLIEGTDKFLIPALWDMHIHLANRADTTLQTQVILPLLTAFGVVGVRDMGSDFDRIQRMRAGIANGSLIGPEILSPGPFIDGPQDSSALFMPVGTDSAARAAVRTLAARGVDFIKVQANLSLECLRAVADEARRQHLSFAGHVPEAVRALDMVALSPRSIEHISPTLPGDAGLLFGCSSREDSLRAALHALEQDAEKPGAVRDTLRARERALQARLIETYDPARAETLFAQMVRRGVWSVPTLIWSQSVRPKNAEELGGDVPMQYFPAAMRKRWETRRRQYIATVPADDLALSARIAIRSVLMVGAMRAAGVRILAGTDAFDAFVMPGYSLHQELALLVDAGFPPLEALQAATRDPAVFLGRQASQGTIERGKRADLLLLDADPLADIHNTRRIAGLVQGGVYRSRQDLDRLLAGVEAAGRDTTTAGR